jgi:hypothetical protein
MGALVATVYLGSQVQESALGKRMAPAAVQPRHSEMNSCGYFGSVRLMFGPAAILAGQTLSTSIRRFSKRNLCLRPDEILFQNARL